jgi:hypothetical protein
VPRLEAILPEREVALLGKECLWGGSYGGGRGFVALGDESIFIIIECIYCMILCTRRVELVNFVWI